MSNFSLYHRQVGSTCRVHLLPLLSPPLLSPARARSSSPSLSPASSLLLSLLSLLSLYSTASLSPIPWTATGRDNIGTRRAEVAGDETSARRNLPTRRAEFVGRRRGAAEARRRRSVEVTGRRRSADVTGKSGSLPASISSSRDPLCENG